ncbi:MAG: hypothetical protein LBR83_01345 [Clostridiales bacterium]|nr:hypothetical protein [Clostridiales bacterium]
MHEANHQKVAVLSYLENGKPEEARGYIIVDGRIGTVLTVMVIFGEFLTGPKK